MGLDYNLIKIQTYGASRPWGGVEAFPGHLETQNKRRGPQVGSIGEHFHLFDPSKLRLFTYQINATNLCHYVLIFFLIYSALKGPMGTV